MKIIRYQEGPAVKWGVVEGDLIREMDGDPFGHFHLTSKATSLQEVKLLSPCLPSKIVALGLNYRDHAEEMKVPLPKQPLLFLKPSTSVIGPGEAIVYPEMSKRVDYEAELAVVIQKAAKAVPEERAAEYILGYTCFNDVTARDLQSKDGQWTRAKGFDTFSPAGPWITDEVSPDDLAIECRVNGAVKQKS